MSELSDATAIPIVLEDVDPEGETPATQAVVVKPSGDQVMVLLKGESGEEIGYVCLEVAGNRVVLDYATAEDFTNGGNNTERVVLRELAPRAEA